MKGKLLGAFLIAKSLKGRKYIYVDEWYPKLEFSKENKVDGRNRENEVLRMKNKTLLDASVQNQITELSHTS